jgi:hypothetical protein
MVYCCNCPQSWEAAGKPVSAVALSGAGCGKYQRVTVTTDKFCTYCGYAAVVTKTGPEELMALLFSEQQKRRHAQVTEISEATGWIKKFERGRTVWRKPRFGTK